MKIDRRFNRVFFQPPTIRAGFDVLSDFVRQNPVLGARFGETKPELKVAVSNLAVHKGRDSVEHDNEEEFFADYRKEPDSASYVKRIGACGLFFHFHNQGTDVSVECPSRAGIDAVMNRFEEAAPASRLPEPDPPPRPKPTPPPRLKIFIGHGNSAVWHELKDHLTDKHDLDVVAYEVGARAGHTIRDILEDMLTASSIAFLVLTGENRDAAGLLHARENVIHETGLFQGRLGFSRAVVLLEEGTVEFSNIHGIDQLRFAKGNVKEVFGDVLAVIRREFGPRA
jgi:Predicted nucleotide-binding protein containing TIR-like domain